MRYAFIEAKKALYPIRLLCRILQVVPSGFYAWRTRSESKHQQRDRELAVRIAAIHYEHKKRYGSPQIHGQMKKQGEAVSKKRVARIMREQGLSAKPPKRFRRTTDSSHNLPVAKNLLGRNFEAEEPDKVWVTDITYVRTWEGWLYLAVVLDLFSRRAVGWAIADHMQTELVLDALRMAIRQRRPRPGLIHHSDRGSQYASQAYQDEIAAHGMVCSMSRKGDCWDNAVAESFFATFKGDLIDRDVWPTKRRTMLAITEYIACYYNAKRGHSTLGYMSPMEYEMAARRESVAA
jgi:transposase InsO family protein